MIDRTHVRRRKASPASEPDTASPAASGVAGQLLRMQSSAGNQATLAMLSRSADTSALRRSPDEDEGKESDAEDPSGAHHVEDLEDEKDEAESEDHADVQEIVLEQAGPGSEEAKSGASKEVAEVLELAEELESGELEAEDSKADDAAPEQIVAVEQQLVEELEGDEVEGEEAKELEEALVKVRKLKAMAFAHAAESESKDFESEG